MNETVISAAREEVDLELKKKLSDYMTDEISQVPNLSEAKLKVYKEMTKHLNALFEENIVEEKKFEEKKNNMLEKMKKMMNNYPVRANILEMKKAESLNKKPKFLY